jgi:hypothetical protein
MLGINVLPLEAALLRILFLLPAISTDKHYSPCRICGGPSGIETGFSPSTSVCPVIIPSMLHTPLFITEAT